ncbi:MAG: NAD-dependent epimerase/dehydratase family protein, partial [Candidatus Dojkabacteria bacterium]|nr:NAD-dependent epimerase/dehydratase family protein [Candidatus Dojkabacteria bacterium]
MATNRNIWVVTGAAGFLGSHVVDVLLARGTPVLAVDDLSSGQLEFLSRHRSDPAFIFVQKDIRDVAGLQELFDKHTPVALVHLAALHFIPACVADPVRTISLNVLGTQCVLAAARHAGIERLFFASTGDVYAPADQPHHEDHSPTVPFN